VAFFITKRDKMRNRGGTTAKQESHYTSTCSSGTQTKEFYSTDPIFSGYASNGINKNTSSSSKCWNENWQNLLWHKVYDLDTIIDDSVFAESNTIRIHGHTDAAQHILPTASEVDRALNLILWDIEAAAHGASDEWEVVRRKIGALYDITQTRIERKPVEALKLLNCLISDFQEWKRLKAIQNYDERSDDSLEDHDDEDGDNEDQSEDGEEDEVQDSGHDNTDSSSNDDSDEEAEEDEDDYNSDSDDSYSPGSDESEDEDEDDEDDRQLNHSRSTNSISSEDIDSPAFQYSPFSIYPSPNLFQSSSSSSNSSSSLSSSSFSPSPSPTPSQSHSTSPSPALYACGLRGLTRRPITKTNVHKKNAKKDNKKKKGKKSTHKLNAHSENNNNMNNRIKRADMTENSTQQGLGTLQDLNVVPLG